MTFLVRDDDCQEGIQAVDVASIYDFKYRGCVRRPKKTWECLVECILH